MIIGICGGSGSGKTSVLSGLKEYYKEFNPTVVSMDNYYLPIEQQQKDENGEINFDLPSSLDREKLFDDVKKLLRGESVEFVEYTFNHKETEIRTVLEPSELIIIEGLFLMYYTEIFDLIDFSVFMDVCQKVQLERRIERDLVARGYSKQEILYQWNHHVLPCYERYVEPYKSLADLVVINERPIKEVIRDVIESVDKHPCMKKLRVLV